MDWLFSRSTIIVLAVLAAILAGLGSWLHARGSLSARRARQCNMIAYGLMSVSMVLFVVAGFHKSAS